jgi:hypothetical protein
VKYGPSRGELIFRLVFSLAGLVFLAVALAIHGVPTGPAFVELGLLAGGFLGGTAVWSAWRLLRRPR